MTIQQRLFIVEFFIKGGHKVTAKVICSDKVEAIKEIMAEHPGCEIISAYPSPSERDYFKKKRYSW